MKILTIIGARPQFVKVASVSRQIAAFEDIRQVIVHTGQHWNANMSEIFFRQMHIPEPDYNLGINNLGHGAMTGRMLEGIEAILLVEKPDRVLVFGDTNSTLAGALAAKKLGFSVVHVESGLRSFNMDMPEEINRILTDRLSDLLFCPTDVAVRNLEMEGFDGFGCRIVRCGDVMKDAADYFGTISGRHSTIMDDLAMQRQAFVLGTIHRQENTDSPEILAGILRGLNRIAEEVDILIPLHPRTRSRANLVNISGNIRFIDPVGYLDMIELLKNCSMVITDSGGLQKEAFFFGKHCVTIRERTEWSELVKGGFSILAGTDEFKIYRSFLALRHKVSDFCVDLYGSGDASRIIVEEIRRG